MAVAQSPKRSDSMKAARPGPLAALCCHDGAHSGFCSSGLAFSTKAEKAVVCLKLSGHLDSGPERPESGGGSRAGPGRPRPRQRCQEGLLGR